jgi:hypothetical protein
MLKKLFKKIRNILPRRTPKGTIMWVQVPMTADSTDEKTNIIISTINHLERNIKIKNHVRPRKEIRTQSIEWESI